MQKLTDLEFRFKSNKSKEEIAELVVFLEITSGSKNIHSVGPLVTDSGGIIKISSAEINKSIQDDIKSSPMDYDNGRTIKQIEVVVEDESQLRERVERSSRFYPKEAQVLNELIQRGSKNKIKSMTYKISPDEIGRPMEILVPQA